MMTIAIVLNQTLTAAPPATTQSANNFKPGQAWLDDEGNLINCHGGGIFFHDGVYYWFGEHKIRRRGQGHDGVACYSSADLYHWKNLGVVLSAGADGDLLDGCIIERPKVVFNAATTKFVMWFHLELAGQGYKAARAAVAVSDTVAGPFKYLGSFRPNAGIWPSNFPGDMQKPLPAGAVSNDDPNWILRRDFAGGQMSRDMTLFVDEDQTAYQIYASEENLTTHVSKLTDDYLKPAGQFARILIGKSNEAASMFKHNGKYYLITSGTTGWAPNAARLAVADHIFGPWKELGNPCVGRKSEMDVTFHSQSACVLNVTGKADAFIYVGDRWKPRDLPNSEQVWLPIRFSGDDAKIAWEDQWNLSVFDRK